MVSKLFLVLPLFLAACSPAVKTVDWVKPIYISKDDVLTEGTAKQILIHNETWEDNND